MKTFGEILRETREKMGFTRDALAREIGISTQALYYYEKNIKKPSSDTIIKLSKTLKISADKLLGIENENLNISSNNIENLKKIDTLLLKKSLIEISEILKKISDAL